MSVILTTAVFALAVSQVILPRRYAFLPLVISAFHIANIELLPELTAARIIILLGLTRAILSGHFRFSLQSRLDLGMLFITFAALISSLGHKPDEWISSPFLFRAGLVVNLLGTYLYSRAYLPDLPSIESLTRLIPIISIPLAVGLATEKALNRNVYHILGAPSERVLIRNEKVRAMGPFRHAILAGTAGATLIPFAFALYRLRHKSLAVVSFASATTIVIASASSGPLAAMMFATGLCLFWRLRYKLRVFIFGCLALAAIYSLISGKGPWYLMARIDLTGGSTGWHRAYLIDQGVRHLHEWWLWGTSYTRHWMPTGVSWNPNHADITNYYLHFGVIGGLPLMGALIYLFSRSIIDTCKQALKATSENDVESYTAWCIMSCLATHAVSCLSISYFDQMYILLFLMFGATQGVKTSSHVALNYIHLKASA